MQFEEAGVTHRVGAAQTDGLVAAAVKLIVADGTGQELCPLGGLHWHPVTTAPSSGKKHVNDLTRQLPLNHCHCKRQEIDTYGC